jgi:hypothetical protein
MVEVPLHEPCDDVTDTKAAPAGTTSVTVRDEAGSGPPLLTVIV